MAELLQYIPYGMAVSLFTGGAVWGTFKLTSKSNTKAINEIKAHMYNKETGELKFVTVDKCERDNGKITIAIKDLGEKIDEKFDEKNDKLIAILKTVLERNGLH